MELSSLVHISALDPYYLNYIRQQQEFLRQNQHLLMNPALVQQRQAHPEFVNAHNLQAAWARYNWALNHLPPEQLMRFYVSSVVVHADINKCVKVKII